jgi:Zn-dependent M28 family amino/carboxypeptidase
VLGYGKPVSVKLDLDCGIVGTFTGANVIGEITGRKHPEQIVDIGGHLDSWDLGTGAIDDGAGVAIAMAAGKLIHDMPQRPDRTVRVIAFANEEMGLWGGIEYATKHASEVAKLPARHRIRFRLRPGLAHERQRQARSACSDCTDRRRAGSSWRGVR